MHAGLVRKVRDHRRVHVDQRPLRMVGEEMPAAGLAPLALAVRRLGERSDLVRAARDAQGVGLPEREGIHRAGRPLAARLAMAVAHGRRLAAHRELHGTAEAAAVVGLVFCHGLIPSLWAASMRVHRLEAFAGTPPFLTETPWMRCRTF